MNVIQLFFDKYIIYYIVPIQPLQNSINTSKYIDLYQKKNFFPIL